MLKVKPYKFQNDGVDYLIDHHYAIVGDEMGLGKSLQAIYLAEITKSKTLVVCPAYLKRTWEREWQKLVSRQVSICVCKTKNNIPTAPQTEVVIINYAQLKYAEHLFKWADLVIADEVHYLKNIEAIRTKIFHHFISDHLPNRFVGLSGTPITNRVPEFYSLIVLCSYNPKHTSGKRYCGSYYSFASKFSDRIEMNIGSRRIVKFEGSRNVPELKSLLRSKYIRRLAKNHLELPEMVFKEVYVDYSKDDGLNEAWEEFNAGKKTANSSAKAQSALKKAKFTTKYCQDLIDEGEKPLLIYSDHIAPAHEIMTNLKCRVKKVTGATPFDERNEIIEMFQRGELDALVATIRSCNTGFTLTAAHNVVFNDISWVGSDNTQAMKRIHRIGQGKRCMVHYILGSIIDEMIVVKVAAKDKVLKEVL